MFLRNYELLKKDYFDIQCYICFQLIESVKTYNEGVPFEEYTRFSGEEPYVIFNDKEIKLSNNIDDATVFNANDSPNAYLDYLVNEIKDGSLKGKYEGVVVIEFDELHHKSTILLHYPNFRYHQNNYTIPIKLVSVDKYSDAYHRAIKRKYRKLRDDLEEELFCYIECRGWKLTPQEDYFIREASYGQLERLMRINRGRNNFIM